jgi:antitoxin (DNA-binding transcriptional repressor) of toxin-antitoxin stability system
MLSRFWGPAATKEHRPTPKELWQDSSHAKLKPRNAEITTLAAPKSRNAPLTSTLIARRPIVAEVSVAVAQTCLGELIARAQAGEAVIIRADRHTAAHLCVWPAARRVFGAEAGKFPIDHRFFEPHPREWVLVADT